MALRDLFNDALNATPEDNARRRATLREVLDAAGENSGDEAILAAIAKIITAREQKAGSFKIAGQTDLAKLEHDEIAVLRGYFRQGVGSGAPMPPPKKPKPAIVAAAAKGGFKAAFTRNQKIIAGVAVGLVAIAAILYFFVFPSGPGGDMLANAGPQKMTVFKDDRTLGSPKAPIVLLEYAAPSCPICARFDTTVFPLLKKEYIDTGKVYYIFRVFPLMPADGAAEAIARCLPADKYFQFIDLLFRNQEKWDPEYQITDVRGGLIQVSRIAGLNADQVDACISSKDAQDRVNQVAQDASVKYDLHGVPDFIINGAFWKTGFVTWPDMKEKLDSLLSKH